MELTLHLDSKKIILHYTWHGSGDKVMLAFHGFGQTGAAMKPVARALETTHRTCLIDIFYHGRSYWEESLGPLTKEQWIIIMDALLEQEGIETFSMTAFSMGGKFLLTTLEGMSERVEHIILIAPDGIKTSTWYSLASYPMLFRQYFRSMIVRPWRFFSLMRVLRKMGLLEKGLARFAETQMDTRRKRRRVYYTWVMFRYLRFDKKKIASMINLQGITTDIYVGKYDRIITSEGMEKLTRHLHKHRLHQMETGHNQLIEASAAKFGCK